MLNMDETTEIIEAGAPEEVVEAPPIAEGSAPPIQSRFLFVDVASLRAKQLRRGARSRLREDAVVPMPHKAERVAMAEVSRGLVFYDISALREPVLASAEGE